MGELTAPQPRPRPELVQLLGETLDAIRAGTAAAEAGIERFAGDPEALLILLEWCRRLASFEAALGSAALVAFGAERAEAPEPAVTRRRRGSHRARPDTGLRAVRGALPAAIIAALRALRHHPAGSHALLTAAGGTAATAATAAIVASVAIGAPPHGPAAAHPSRLVPPGVTWTASPEPSPAARVRARPRLDVRSASPPPPALPPAAAACPGDVRPGPAACRRGADRGHDGPAAVRYLRGGGDRHRGRRAGVVGGRGGSGAGRVGLGRHVRGAAGGGVGDAGRHRGPGGAGPGGTGGRAGLSGGSGRGVVGRDCRGNAAGRDDPGPGGVLTAQFSWVVWVSACLRSGDVLAP